jgi:quinoprotein glucose dehydrogenase
MKLLRTGIILLTLAGACSPAIAALPVVHQDGFEKGAKAWLPSDAKKWTVDRQQDGNHVLHLHGKSDYQPPFRSPHSITLLKDKVVGDFVLTAKVRTLQTTRGHRDMCIFFGFQNPSQFYYVHLGETPDPHSSQVFIVNREARTKITETPDIGIPWPTKEWHDVKVVRKVASGLIEIYFDDMEKPQKVAHDKTFKWGAVGLGSFDDLGLWDDFELRGVTIKQTVDQKFVNPPKPKKKAPKKPSKKKTVNNAKQVSGIAKATASETQTGHSPANVLDGRNDTKWAANGKGQWLQVEFGQEREIDGISIGFVSGHRKYDFELQDRKGKSLGKFTSSGKGDQPSFYSFTKSKLSRVRIVVNGNSENTWANIHAVFLGQSAPAPKATAPASGASDQASSLKFTKWSGKLNLPDPVAIAFDNVGNAYVTQTQRRKANDLDIRSNQDWIPDDVGFQTVEDKRAHFRKHLTRENSKANEKRVKDLNGDGSHDIKDLTVLTERVYKVEDTDGDGIADRRTTYAEEFNSEVTGIAAGVLWHEGDVYATVAPDVWRMRDTTGDGKADKRDVMAHGFGLHIAYGGHDMHGLRVGPDGRIYWTIGDKGISVVDQQGKRHHYPNQGGMMRCDPDGSNFEVFAHGLRNVQEPAFDEYGNWFGVDNDSDKAGEKERFVYIVEGMDAGWRNNYQYRGSGFNPWMDEGMSIPFHENQPAHIVPPIRNYEDGPCGFVYNPGTALNPAYRNYFFLTEAPRGTQWAFQVHPKGASFEMVNSHQIGTGIALIGWNFGPDGALYSVDWAGGYPLNQTGHIWKIDDPKYAEDAARVEVKKILGEGFSERADQDLGKLLGHIDQRVRLGAQFELVKRGSAGIFCVTCANSNRKANLLAKIHSIWGMGQLARLRDDKLSKRMIIAKLKDEYGELCVQAIKVLSDLKSDQFDTSVFTPLLASKNPRIQFHAALAAGKHGVKAAFNPILTMGDRLKPEDVYLRHAVITGLAGSALAKQLTALQEHENAIVRLCAVVALRERSDAGIGKFLNDSSDWVAAEAARGIHDDWSISGALPALANALGQNHVESFARRAINANLRLGSPENALRVAKYIRHPKADPAIRGEALDALANWIAPPLLDRVDGRRRELGQRDPKTISTTIATEISQVLKSGDNKLIEKAVALSTQLKIELESGALIALLENRKAPASLRVVALQGLNTLPAITYALKDKEAKLRSQGTRMLALTDELRALPILDSVLQKSKSIHEQQHALGTLALMESQGAKDTVAQLASKLSRGGVPSALQLDVIEAATKLSVTNQLAGFEKKRDPEQYTDQFIECLEGGDPAAGLEVIKTHIYAQCVRCHKLDKSKGGSIIGPNLKNVGSKGREYILHSMIEPNKLITQGYGTINVQMKGSDEVIGGQFRKETKTHIEVRLPDKKVMKLKKADIALKTPVVSIMPTMGNILTKRQLRDVIEYLSGLKEK